MVFVDCFDSMLLTQFEPFLVIDFSMVSGMDTSAIDLFNEILSLCKNHNCSLYLSGLSSELKVDLIFAGIKPIPGSSRFLFSSDLETALAQAEDGLLSSKFRLEEKDEEESDRRRRQRSESTVEDGFLYALKKIDEQHRLNTLLTLREFRSVTIPVELEPLDVLDREEGQGLYFVETGILYIRHASNQSTRNMLSVSAGTNGTALDPNVTLGAMNARVRGSIHQVHDRSRLSHVGVGEQSFRLARLG